VFSLFARPVSMKSTVLLITRAGAAHGAMPVVPTKSLLFGQAREPTTLVVRVLVPSPAGPGSMLVSRVEWRGNAKKLSRRRIYMLVRSNSIIS